MYAIVSAIPPTSLCEHFPQIHKYAEL